MSLFGTRFDADVKAASRDAKDQRAANRKVQRTIDKWLQTGPRQFRDPVGSGATIRKG